MVSVSSSSDKIKQDPTCLSSRLQAIRTSTLPCRSVRVAKVPRHIWRSTMRAFRIVRLLDRVVLCDAYSFLTRYSGRVD